MRKGQKSPAFREVDRTLPTQGLGFWGTDKKEIWELSLKNKNPSQLAWVKLQNLRSHAAL